MVVQILNDINPLQGYVRFRCILLSSAYFGGSGTPISAEVEHRFRRKWNTDFGMWNTDFGMWNIHSGGSGTPVPES